MEFLKNAVNETISLAVAAIVEHAAYPFQVEDKIRELASATRDLVAMKEDVKTIIMNAERENSAPTKQVEEWLNKVKAIEKEAKEIMEIYRKCHWSIWSNYTTGRSAVEKLCEVKSLCDQRSTIVVIMHVPPPLAQEMPISSSKSANLELALEYIKDDVHGTIGIYGTGGVGKTHLLKQINNELIKDSTFNVVIFLTCSKECSEEKVQNQIIDKLGLNSSDSIERKQITIFNFLKKKSFLLILDDLRNRINLEIIGIPNPSSLTSKHKGKVVLTTRSTKVCGLMEVEKKIKVDILNWNAAWNLFKEKVTEETIVSHPLIEKYAVEIVKQLGGLPLDLITVGRAMNDRTDPSEWKLVIEFLKQARLRDVELKHEQIHELLKNTRARL
ncbi:disease resistance protein RPS2-like protein [Carex littledalei]|uniref:Disease resistance protein RPS2-like protein n=1 Tax=Carex littledalei TaxID=544730 RepID=A0A833QZR0_9POAL|nr:disease resistance protein RPS2-like protein [Carex littledalei]